MVYCLNLTFFVLFFLFFCRNAPEGSAPVALDKPDIQMIATLTDHESQVFIWFQHCNLNLSNKIFNNNRPYRYVVREYRLLYHVLPPSSPSFAKQFLSCFFLSYFCSTKYPKRSHTLCKIGENYLLITFDIEK